MDQDTLDTEEAVAPYVPSGKPAKRGKPRRPSEADLDYPVVSKQLRFLQFLVAVAAGAACGELISPGGMGALLGWLTGFAIAAIHIGLLGGLAGAVAGGMAGWNYSDGNFQATVIWALASLALGACLGDWRRWPAPPGGLLSTASADEPTDAPK